MSEDHGFDPRQKVTKVRINGQIFSPKMFGLPLYLPNAAPSTSIKHNLNGLAYEMRKKRITKREGKRERREEKMGDQIAKKTPKHLHVHTFSLLDPCTMTFCE